MDKEFLPVTLFELAFTSSCFLFINNSLLLYLFLPMVLLLLRLIKLFFVAATFRLMASRDYEHACLSLFPPGKF